MEILTNCLISHSRKSVFLLSIYKVKYNTLCLKSSIMQDTAYSFCSILNYFHLVVHPSIPLARHLERKVSRRMATKG